MYFVLHISTCAGSIIYPHCLCSSCNIMLPPWLYLSPCLVGTDSLYMPQAYVSATFSLVFLPLGSNITLPRDMGGGCVYGMRCSIPPYETGRFGFNILVWRGLCLSLLTCPLYLARFRTRARHEPYPHGTDGHPLPSPNITLCRKTRLFATETFKTSPSAGPP